MTAADDRATRSRTDAHDRRARRLGYPAAPPGWAPPPDGTPRPAAAVVDRLLASRAVAAVAHGVESAVVRRWLALVGGEDALLADEIDYLDDAAEGVRVEDAARRLGVEAAWALAWALGLVGELDWSSPVGAEAADVLPSPAAPGALAESLLAPALRDHATLADERALAARLLAGLAADPDLEIGVAPGEVDPYVVRERHRALAWLLGGAWT